jgi:hypothetical protein
LPLTIRLAPLRPSSHRWRATRPATWSGSTLRPRLSRWWGRPLVHFVQPDRLDELGELARTEVAPFTLGNALDLQRSDPGPRKLEDRIANPLHHAADDSVPALVNDDAENSSGLLVANRTDHSRNNSLPLELHTPGEFLQYLTRRVPVEQHLVLFFQFEARVGHAMREFPIVGQEQEAGRRPVEPSDRHDTLRNVDQVEHGAPASLVARGGNVARRLVEQDVAVPLGTDERAVDLDPVALRIDLRAERSDRLAIDMHATLKDELFGPTTRRDATGREHFLQSLHNDLPRGRIGYPNGPVALWSTRTGSR